MADKVAERFAAKYFIEPNSGCWLWTGSLVHDGYPQFYDGVTMVRAHRHSYKVNIGPIEDGLLVCHKCDTPSCVNPDHLFLGTQRENLADCRKKDRIYKKLNNSKVAEIKRLAALGATLKTIATKFGINPSMVHYIKHAAHHGS